MVRRRRAQVSFGACPAFPRGKCRAIPGRGVKVWPVVVLMLLAGCQSGPGSTEASTVIEGDGATLTLPPGALPEGTTAADVSITRLSAAQLAAVGLDDAWHVYQLEPEGIELAKSATVGLPLQGSNVTPVLHVHGDEVSYLDVRATLDPVEGHRLEADIDGFSFVVVRQGKGPGVHAALQLPEGKNEYPIGQTVPWFHIITYSTHTFVGPIPVPGLAAGTPVTAVGSLSAVATTITPAGPVADRPQRITQTVPAGSIDSINPLALSSVSDFRCASAGIARIRGDLTVTATGVQLDALDPLVEAAAKMSGRSTDGYTLVKRAFTMDLDVYSSPAECVAAGPTARTLIDPDGLKCPGVQEPTLSESGQVQGKKLTVHKLKDGQCYPAHQFRPSGEDQCKQVHYHVRLTSLAGTVRNDSQPCGAAKDSDIAATGDIWISEAQYARVGPP